MSWRLGAGRRRARTPWRGDRAERSPASFRADWAAPGPESADDPRPPLLGATVGSDPIGRGYEITPPNRAEAWASNPPGDDREVPVGLLTLALIAALGLAWLGGTHLVRWALERPALTGA